MNIKKSGIFMRIGRIRRLVVRRFVAFGDWAHFRKFGDWSFRDWSFEDWSFGDWSFGDWSFGDWSVYHFTFGHLVLNWDKNNGLGMEWGVVILGLGQERLWYPGVDPVIKEL
jgi:hypothetical protein